jgi:hypothetical protein
MGTDEEGIHSFFITIDSLDVKHVIQVGPFNSIFTAWGISSSDFSSEKITILL